jgi:hypothetical protein
LQSIITNLIKQKKMENLNLSALGIVSENNANILNKSNLNWKVKTENLVTESGLITDNIAVIREDTNKILGIHKDGYHTVQNSEVLELLLKLAQTTGTELHRGGEMIGGEFVYFQLKTNDLNLGKDKIKGFATGINSHNGKISLGLGHSNLTISCMNTFYMAYRQTEYKIKHTKNMQSKIDLLASQFDKVLIEEKETFEKIKRMSEIEIDPKLKDIVLGRFLQLGKEEKLGDLSTLSTRKTNILSEIETNISHQIKDKGENLWGLFSGFTRYTTHGLKGSEIENKIIGNYGKRELDIFETLTESILV